MFDPNPTIQKALELFLGGDISGGKAVLLKAANAGDQDAMHRMGTLYDKGIGVGRDPKMAHKWWTQAADLGHTEAILDLSRLYMDGDGAPADLEKALELCEKAGTLGNPRAYLVLARVYETGFGGVPPNIKLAALNLQKAADKGCPAAFFHLSRFYFQGTHFQKDIRKAFQLLEQAAEADDPVGLDALAYFYETGQEGHPVDLKKAYSLYRRAARGWNENAIHSILRFPPIVEMGAISCSAEFADLSEHDRQVIIRMHQSGHWGEVDPEEWDRNDAALAAGEPVSSLHLCGPFDVVVYTDAERASSYIYLLDELSADEQPVTWAELKDVAKRLGKLVKRYRGAWDHLHK